MIPLWMQIGLFIWRLPQRMEERPLDQFLAELAIARPRVLEADTETAVRRIRKISRRWLRRRPLARRNTCYIRSLVLFRFLDSRGGDLRFHLGTEPARAPGDTIHGHAWVTLDGRALEPLPAAIVERLSNLYTYPPASGGTSGPAALQSLAEETPANA